jgi:uncharacterized protein (DUF2236 family)
VILGHPSGYHPGMESILPAGEECRALAVAPGSVTWRYASDARTMLGAGAALLLQVAHPTVAAGVREHSDFQRDPWGRLLRTLDFVNLLIYGGPDAAARTGRAVREMHKSIKGVAPGGRRYHALEPEAYAWVHATLAEVIIRSHRAFGRRLQADELERFYVEWKAVGRLLGVRDRDLPDDWWTFRAYVDAMVHDRLEDNDVVRTVLGTLTAPAAPPLPSLGDGAWQLLSMPASKVLQRATVGLLPRALRDKLDLEWTARERAELRVIGAVTRRATPVMPRALRRTGPGYLRMRSEAIAHGQFAA